MPGEFVANCNANSIPKASRKQVFLISKVVLPDASEVPVVLTSRGIWEMNMMGVTKLGEIHSNMDMDYTELITNIFNVC